MKLGCSVQMPVRQEEKQKIQGFKEVNMIGSNAFNYINVLQAAANAGLERHEVINHNIANVDTPNYKRKDVQFETYLYAQVAGGDSLDENIDNIELESLLPTTYVDEAGLSYRMDGNNVNIATEEAELAKNQMRIYGLMDSMTQEFSRLRAVLERTNT